MPLYSHIQNFDQNIQGSPELIINKNMNGLRPPAIKRQTKLLSLTVFTDFKKGQQTSDEECESPLFPIRHSHIKHGVILPQKVTTSFRPRLMTCDETVMNFTQSNLSD